MSATCGCCTGIHVETPRTIFNRPGLSAIAYRAGDFTSFKRSMLAALTKTRITTRDDDDFSIALLDAWATTADVLTFYQERIANESYLSTAGERDSVLRLARLVGYELGPGVAAFTHLAFVVDDAEGSPKRVTIAAGSKVQSVPGQDESPRMFETSIALDARAAWNELRPRTTELHDPTAGDTEAYLAGTATTLRTGDALLFRGSDDTDIQLRRLADVQEDFTNNRTRVTWTPALEAFEAAAEVFAMRVIAPLFGNNAADPRTLSDKVLGNYSQAATDEWPFGFTVGNDADIIVDVDGPHPEIAPGSRMVLMNGTGFMQLLTIETSSIVTIAKFAMVGKATRVKTKEKVDAKFATSNYRGTLAFAAPEKLTIAERPLSASAVLTVPIELDRHVDWIDGDKLVIISGLSAVSGDAFSEVANVEGVEQTDTHTTLEINKLAHSYRLDSVRISANVVEATDGETVRETLGSGDAATPFQSFRLSHKPLTYVYAPGGTASTLTIFVNDIRWHEVETLYGQGPRARAFVTRTADDGGVTVQFGDGVESGARLPTGHDNVRAVYRKGIGVDGNLAAGKLTLLMSRPLGLSGANNPLPAGGGADPELMKDARRNAPRTVVTLDRVVSLTDYQAYAASFPGVAKALATWTMTDTARQVFLTVAGTNGLELASDSITIKTLRTSLIGRGDPYVPLRIASFELAKFVVKANITVHPDHLAAVVLPKVKTAVRDAFAFEAMEFGRAVDLSDLMTVMQNVEGVTMVDIDHLYRLGDPPARNERLVAAMPLQHDDVITPAEILVLHYAKIEEAK